MSPVNAPSPIVKVVLQHTLGATSTYKPGIPAPMELGGIKEAIVTCASNYGDNARVDLLRSDIPGADWTKMEAGGAYPEFQAILRKAALDLLDGHQPQVVVTLDGKTMVSAELMTSETEVAEALKDQSKRSLLVPRLLPFQLGGGAAGAIGILYNPKAGGGIRLHSIHSTAREAIVAEQLLKSSGEERTAQMAVATPVTKLIAAVVAGTFVRSAPNSVEAAQREAAAEPARVHPGLMGSPLAMGAPTPFSSN
ncbi:hypothetical protein ABIC83_002582 [Roseateles asaccharophilus]|uniref:hypothetical protein n=1 Tax=Roseateles asaccharophilus TaxID=582607 RepID=UPI003834A22E